MFLRSNMWANFNELCDLSSHPRTKEKNQAKAGNFQIGDDKRFALFSSSAITPKETQMEPVITNLSEKVKVRKILPPHGQVWFPFAKSDSCQNGGRIIRRRKKSQWMWIHLGCSITFLWPIKDANGWISQNRPVPSSPWFAASVLLSKTQHRTFSISWGKI